MNKYIIGFIVFVIVVALAIVLLSSRGLLGSRANATFGETKVSLDVADTQKEQEKGLSGRNSLAEDRGMIFLFEQPGYPSFWMKGMKFPIDIIFLNDNKIVTIYKNVQPPEGENDIPTQYYQPTSPANRVIELRAGKADEYGLKVGDTIDLSL